MTGLTASQLQLLRLAAVSDVPIPREHRHEARFADVELLALLGLMEPRGALYLDQLLRRDRGSEPMP